MKKTAIAAALLFLIFTAGCKHLREENLSDEEFEDTTEIVENYTDQTTPDDTIIIEEPDTSRILVKDTLNIHPDSVKTEPVMIENEDGSLKKVSEEEIKKEEQKNSRQKPPHVKKFYIIAGSFQNMSNAVNLRTFFKTKGYPAMILYPFKGYNRVATGSYPDRTSAEQDIKKFRSMNLYYEKQPIEYWLLWR